MICYSLRPLRAYGWYYWRWWRVIYFPTPPRPAFALSSNCTHKIASLSIQDPYLSCSFDCHANKTCFMLSSLLVPHSASIFAHSLVRRDQLKKQTGRKKPFFQVSRENVYLLLLRRRWRISKGTKVGWSYLMFIQRGNFKRNHKRGPLQI